MPPDPIYVASVAETVQTGLRNTDDPEEIRRYLYELKDILYEADFESDLAEELHDNLSEDITNLSRDLNKPIDDSRRAKIIDNVHRIERFYQRRSEDQTSETQPTDTASQEHNVTISVDTNTNSDGTPIDWSEVNTTQGDGDSQNDSTWGDDEQWNSDFIGDNEPSNWNLTTPLGSTSAVLQDGSEWPMYRRNLHQSGADSDVGSFDTPSLQWETYIGEIPRGEPVVLGELLVVPTKDEGLKFLDKDTGRLKHEFDPGPQCYQSPVVYDNKLYCGFDDGLYAVDQWGNQDWKYPTNDPIRCVPLVYDGTIFFGDVDGNFYAIDADTGDLNGSYSCDGIFRVSPTIHDGIVIAGTGHTAFGFDYETGRVDWETRIKTDQNSSSKAPCILNGYLYYPGIDAVHKLDPDTGETYWSTDISEYGSIKTSIGCGNDSIFAPVYDFDSEEAYLIILDQSGSITNTKWFGFDGKPTSPVVTSFGVIVGLMEGRTRRFNTSGKRQWSVGSRDDSDWTIGAPIVSNSTLYVSFGRSMYAYS